MAAKSGQSWKMTRASVSVKNKTRPRSNKYSKHDTDEKPSAGTRSQVWVGAYDRPDGTHVKGYYRSIAGKS